MPLAKVLSLGTLARVRRLFVILLMIVLPVQFAFAAASGYCGHESGSAARHIGHHVHQHAGQSQVKETKAASLSHADCEMCHFGFSVPSVEVQMAAHVPPGQDVFGDPVEHPSHIPALPERPDRSRAA